jgi:uncharacterized protein
MTLLSVSAHDIDAAGLGLDAELPAAWLDAELRDACVRARAPGPDGGHPQLPGRVTVRLSRSGNEIVVRGRVRAALVTPCARCLEPAAVDVDAELSLFLQPVPAQPAGKSGKQGHHAPPPAKGTNAKPAKGKAARGLPGKGEEEYEFSADEADHDTYDGETVVLDGFVREALLLEVPNFPLCSEGCPGIRPAAEAASAEGASVASPALDPRLSPLGALRAKLEAKKNKE